LTETSVFERHPRATLAAVWLAFLLLFAAAAELALRHFTGMGYPVLFYSHPVYGYRMLPNQETWRFGGAHFKINNLGLRADEDWDRAPQDKILFVGDSVTYGGNRISNADLFSAVAARGLNGWRSGNAGIPNWGVENVYGLVVQERFLPAAVYVTTFIEDDFYRGLQTGRNKPWIKYQQPALALQELAEFLWYKNFTQVRELNRLEREAEPAQVRVARAAAKLKEMDEFLKARGLRHVIFISPTRPQAMRERPRDPLVKAELDKAGVPAIYILDKPRLRAASPEQVAVWYHDIDHLTKEGHAVWGEIMREDLGRLVGARAVVAGR
jgi:hypothetical protein